MISQARREQLRRLHNPTTDELLDEIGVLEAQLRLQHEQIQLLKQANDGLRAKILRAVQELS